MAAGNKKPTKRPSVARSSASGRTTAPRPQQEAAAAAGAPKAPRKGAKGQRPSDRDLAREASDGKKKRRWPKVVLLVSLAVVLAGVGLFSWDRWFRYDDAHDLQGAWTHAETGTPVTIDEDSLALAEDVEYQYTLDPWAKTISYTFGDLKGSGAYQFSPDRTRLAIVEGGTSNPFDDLAVALGMKPVGEEGGQNMIVLVRQ